MPFHFQSDMAEGFVLSEWESWIVHICKVNYYVIKFLEDLRRNSWPDKVMVHFGHQVPQPWSHRQQHLQKAQNCYSPRSKPKECCCSNTRNRFVQTVKKLANQFTDQWHLKTDGQSFQKPAFEHRNKVRTNFWSAFSQRLKNRSFGIRTVLDD